MTRAVLAGVMAAGVLAATPIARDLHVAQDAVFRSAIDAVTLDVLVTERTRVISNLRAADFTVTDNGVPQTVVDVTRDTLPLDVTMVIDTSGSIGPRLLDSLVSAVNQVRRRLRADDRVQLITFDQRIRERVALTPVRGQPEFTLTNTAGATALYDAMAMGMAAPAPIERRQMLIVFTDGMDSMSFLTADRVLDVARRSRAAVFVVATRALGARLPTDFFTEVAGLTGGMVQIVDAMTSIVSTGTDNIRITSGGSLLDNSFLKAVEDFRTSYVIRYHLTGVTRDGWHEVVVRVPKGDGKYTIRARRGYVAAPMRQAR